jgi:ABC-type taurine transport system ATPase subunit
VGAGHDTFSVEKFRKWVEEFRKAVNSIFDSIDPDLKIVLVEHAPHFTLGYIPPDCPLRNDPRFHASFKELSDAILEMEQRIEKRFGFDALHNVRYKLLSPPQTLMTIPTKEVLEALVPDRTGRLFQTSIEVAVNQYFGKYRGLKREAQETWWKTGHASRDLQTDFQSTLGLAPWTVLNNAYEAAGLDLRIAPPELDGTDLFKLEFTRGANVKVNLGALSSGEQIAAAIGVGLYQSQPGSLRPLTPKLLLLDEIDAPLHPLLTKQVLTLLEELATRLDMCVVMTTHSPTTVALAGKDAIFEKLPGRGLKKIAKGKALNLLLTGVPALALDFEGQRQVFVEAPSDAKVFSTLYQQMRAKLPSERSLDFISAGTRDAQTGNEEGGGCANAKRIVKSLVKNGNTSVFGLVDWDRGKNRPTPRIVVLGSGSRYSIENFVFDPLLLAAAICRDCPSFAPQIGIPSHVGLPELQKIHSRRVAGDRR